MRLALALLFAPACALHAEGADPAGRWQGTIAIPEAPVHATVDIDRGADGAWIGSITIAELAVAGAPLKEFAAAGEKLAFAIDGALALPGAPAARFDASFDGADALTGTFTQAGNSARFDLRRSGAAQVETPPASTPVARELEGTWNGEYELMGSARHATLTLANSASGPASAKFVIVGKRTYDLPVDLLQQDGDYLRIESHAYGIVLDARLRGGAIEATYQQGAIEIPFVLRRAEGTK